MANRTTFTGASTDVPWGNTPEVPEGLGDQYARFIKTLLDAAALPLTSMAGTANDVTAALDPVLPPGGLLDGMKFTLTWAATNTDPMTLAINGGAAVDVLDAAGGTMIPGAAVSGTRALIEFTAGAFRVLSGGGEGGGGGQRYYWQFTASGTWSKPAGLSDDTMVFVEAWGGGGGGSPYVPVPAGSGGGGSYARSHFRLGDLPASVAVGVGAGGPPTTSGGSAGFSTFGALLIAYGGGNASGTNGSTPGAGAGLFGPAVSSTPGPLGGGPTLPEGGGNGANPGVPGSSTYFGGAGGGDPGGTSRYGGNGGSVDQAGQAPGGGGGARAQGGRGEVRVWI